MEFAVETDSLNKQFKKTGGWRRLARQQKTTAVKDVTLRVGAHELFGLLGPNGAGKTTLVKMLCTLILPSSGTATVAGHPLHDSGAIRADVGLVVADERSFYWRLSGRRNLEFFAALHHLPRKAVDRRVNEVLAAVEMTEWSDSRFSDYSTGMKQRMAIARSLLHHPKVLFLDEPSRSLDPTATQKLHELLRQLISEERVTIFLITHDLAEAEKLCDRVAVMHRGQIRAVGPPPMLREQLARDLRYLVRVDAVPDAVEKSLRQWVPELTSIPLGEQSQLQFLASETDGRLTAVIDCLRQHNLTIYSVEGAPPTLEEVFAYFTGEES